MINVSVNWRINCMEFVFVNIDSPCWRYIWFWSISLNFLRAVETFFLGRSVFFSWVKIFSGCLLFFQLFYWFIGELFCEYILWALNILFSFEIIAQSMIINNLRFLCAFTSASFLVDWMINSLQQFFWGFSLCV